MFPRWGIGGYLLGVKRVLIVVLVLICLAVVVIEAFVLRDELDLDTELEEYQIHVDYGKMAQGILGLFSPSPAESEEGSAYTAPSEGSGSATVHEPAAAHATAPTVPTLHTYSGG